MNNKNIFFETVVKYIKEGNLQALKNFLLTLTAVDVAEGLKELNTTEQTVVFRLLPKDFASEVFDILEASMQHDLIESFGKDQAGDLIQSLEPEDRVRLLDEFPAKVAKRMLAQLPKEQRDMTAYLMGYADDTVGRIMSPIYVDIKKDMTVAQAIERIRQKIKNTDMEINNVYVTDAKRKLEGCLSISTLIASDENKKISDLIEGKEINFARTDQDQEQAARLLQELDVVEIPVLDKEQRLVGVLSSDDAMSVLEEEVTDDMFDKVGLVDITSRESDRSHKLLKGSFMHVFAVRVPFLLITLAGGMLAGLVIDTFEEILEAVVATAIFIPVIMDMGGNVGTQSSTIFTRGLVLGQINMRRFYGQWAREVLFGSGMAVVLGTLGGVVAGVWQGMPELGYAVGVSLTLTIIIGIAMGFLVPFVLIKLGFDQAAGADPIITTIKDMSGLAIYFASVSYFMPQIREALNGV